MDEKNSYIIILSPLWLSFLGSILWVETFKLVVQNKTSLCLRSSVFVSSRQRIIGEKLESLPRYSQPKVAWVLLRPARGICVFHLGQRYAKCTGVSPKTFWYQRDSNHTICWFGDFSFTNNSHIKLTSSLSSLLLNIASATLLMMKTKIENVIFSWTPIFKVYYTTLPDKLVFVIKVMYNSLI